MKTEEEARKCWCPFARTMVTSDERSRRFHSAHNRWVDMDEKIEGRSHCIASDCMAWREGQQIGITPEGHKVDRDVDGRTRWHDTGFCGLAGKP